MTIADRLDGEQRAVLDRPFADAYVAIAGAAGTGKSAALVSRAVRALAELPEGGTVLMTAASASGIVRLQDEIRDDVATERIRVAALADVAYEVLDRSARTPVTRIDDADAAAAFVRAAEPLVSMEWEELAAARIDPEITGFDKPVFFLAATFRFIRKLRAAGIDPKRFATIAFQGATTFYGRVPNLASPDLITQTNEKYRDSLRVDAEELARQHGREVDLIKILEELYARYVETIVDAGQLSPSDAVLVAAEQIRSDRAIRAAVVARYPFAFVDDAQDLMSGDMTLLRAIYGDALHGVTIAGDAAQASRSFAGARGTDLFVPESTIRLATQHRARAAIVALASRAESGDRAVAPRGDGDGSVKLAHFGTLFEEASATARRIDELIRDGTPAHEIAVIARTLRCVGPFVSSLLDRNVPITIAGETNLFAFREVEDALAPLWALADPYRHDWLLRTLAAPWLALSDASIATLCADPSTGQTALFELPEASEIPGRRRRDRTRDVRLALATLRGDCDADLSAEARERLGRFRIAHERWTQLERTLPVAELARVIIAETAAPRETLTGRGRFAAELTRRLEETIADVAGRRPLASLRDVLSALESRADGDPELMAIATRPKSETRGCVNIFSVEAAKGREFSHVFIVDVHAGAFPRYYTPEAFLFTHKLGMIPKNNVGDAAASRTAKYTYATHANRTVQQYNKAERKAFVSAIGRARDYVWISASGRVTRAINTPEFLDELI